MLKVGKDSVPDSSSDNHIRRRFSQFGELNDALRPGLPRASQSQERRGLPFGTRKRVSRLISDRDKKELAEERRLLGDYSNDPASVRIAIPGTSSSNKLKSTLTVKSFSSFKPTNTLSVRPNRTTSRPQSIDSRSPYFNPKPKPDVSSDNEDGARPRKKQKTEMSNVVESDNEKIAHSSSSLTIPSTLNPRSPVGSCVRSKQRAIQATLEYWQTEMAVQPPTASAEVGKKREDRLGDCYKHFDAEEFVKGARMERISRASVQNPRTELLPKSSVRTRSAMRAVEIPKQTAVYGQGAGDSIDQANDETRNLDLRESSDELQGEKTVRDTWRRKATVSPSNIRPTYFWATPKSRRREDLKRRSGHEKAFCINSFRCGADVVDGPLQGVIDKDEVRLLLKTTPTSAPFKSYDIKKAISVYHDFQDDITKLRLKLSRAGDADNVVDMTFLSGKDCRSFCDLIQKLVPDIKEHVKTSEWMNKVFSRTTPTKRVGGPSFVLNSQSPIEALPESKDADLQPSNPKRTKLSDGLLNGNVNEITAPTKKKLSEDASIRKTQTSRVLPADSLSHSHPQANKGIPIPVKTYKPPTVYATRSKTRQEHLDIESDNDNLSDSSLDRGKAKKWTKPLVYPKVGKKRAEVEAHDLARLRVGEFLNDNLIEIYIRFLEHHLERQRPEILKRTYFFNSFFFASLTNTPRGKKGINYQGVEKWTRSADIFSRDFVVVPINESAHWYMAIICNLPTLFTPSPDIQGDAGETMTTGKANAEGQQSTFNPGLNEDREVTNNIPGSGGFEIGKDENLASSLRTMALSDKSVDSSSQASAPESPKGVEYTDKDEWPEEDENQVSISSKHQAGIAPVPPPNEDGNPGGTMNKSKNKKKRGHKSRPSLPKHEPKQPIIITFDSLGCSRSPTIRALREYLEEEAKSKRFTDIDGKKIKGMTAQQIPLQPNFSDCGLYLLAYLEKFVQDPDTFVRKLLQREMDSKDDWPNLRSGVLRRRLRSFLHQLYDEERSEKRDGPLLVDYKPLNILLVDADSDRPDKKLQDVGSSTTPSPLRAAEVSPKLPAEGPLNPSITDSDKVKASNNQSRLSTPTQRSVSSEEKADKSKTSALLFSAVQERADSPDSLLDELEELVSKPPEPKTRQYKDVVEIPGTPPPEEENTETDRASNERILGRHLLSSPLTRSKIVRE
ncbi:Ulp1 protease [Coccidioides immitis RS]|uniref:Ulp1 protease n=3 Tax=Coccidioides immitis TaxID=5501 RepID=A0A0E1RXI9_COCIM|nr:Ulp1 protease [Coccidioides immitis RS]EAS31065.2 Ulp1 protease [Coccidioides immitis RS]KMP03665.1 Ulp1 protease family protein [Coccidioides immitis RMSCC 2394]